MLAPVPSTFSDAERGLLLEIERSPADDPPRLVYADWLAEQGEPELAELVVVQCALAAHDTLDRERHRNLVARQAALVRAAERKWIARLGLPARDCSLARGLPCRLEMTAADFVACDFRVPADVLLPELVLRFEESSTEAQVRAPVEAALASPNLDRVRRLDLSGVGYFADSHMRRVLCGDLIAQLLSSSPRVAGLRGLALRACGLTDPGAATLAAASTLAGLATLDLEGNDLTGTGARALAGSASLLALQTLHLADNRIEEEAVEPLRAALGERLRLGKQFRPKPSSRK